MSPKPTTHSDSGASQRDATSNVTGGLVTDNTRNTEAACSLGAINEAGITLVVSLLEASEACKAGLADEPGIVRDLGMTFIAYPIKDYQLPPSEQEYLAFVHDLWQRIHTGEQALVHCYGGIGRSGMIVAGILICDGLSPLEAFAYASSQREHPVPDTDEQKQWVTSLYQSLANLRSR